MRTIKALVCAAALAAGLATSLADSSNVYSLNDVGYYNIPIAANSAVMIANQLNTTNNTIGVLIPNGPPSANLYKFNAGNWATYSFDPDDLTWYPDSLATLNMGEAALFKSPTACTLTFVGEVQQGALQVNLIQGALCARSSIVPQAGLVTSELLFPGQASDNIYKQNNNNWATYSFDPDDLTWYPTEPTFGVGEGFLSSKVGATTAWTRSFTVN
jgi:hypothetical protein